MSLPPPSGNPMAPPVPRSVPMPATPSSPLEPLRQGRRLDRRHWLLAGLLGITGGAMTLQMAQGPLVSLLGRPEATGWDVIVSQVAVLAFGVLAIVAAFLLAPGSIGRRLAGVLLLVVLVAAGFALQHTMLVVGGVPMEVRWVASAPSLVVLGGVVGWVLASGARWWAWLAVLPTPAVAALPMLAALEGLTSGIASLLVSGTALLVALLTLVLTIPGRR